MKTTTASRDPELFEKIQDIVRDIEVAMMTTVTPDGALHSRPMVTADFIDDGEIWFFTSDDSGKAQDLSAEHGTNLSYADPKTQRYVSVTGNAELVHDPERAKELWEPSLKAYFPRGLEDPHLALIRVRIETTEFWDFGAEKKQRGRRDRKNGSAADDAEESTEQHAKVDVRATPASG